MKILYFTPYFSPQSEAAATRAFWFTKTLENAGHKLEILNGSQFFFSSPNNKERSIFRLLKENRAGLELFFRVLTNKADLVVLSTPPFFTVLWGALACYISSKKYILDVRDLYPDVFFELKLIKRESALGKLAVFFTSLLYSKAFQIISVTQNLCKEIENYGVGNANLIMNGYDSELFQPGKPEEKFEKFTLVFHGTLGKVQNIQTLLQVAKVLENDPNIHFIVAGEGPKAKELIENPVKNLSYLGNIPYNDIPALLRKSHMGLSFRTDDKIGKEAFPVKTFEYMGSALPIIMTPRCEAGDVIEHFSFGKQFNNSDIDQIVNFIRETKTNGGKAPESHDIFSRENQSKKILELLKQL